MSTRLYLLLGPNEEIRYIGKTRRSLEQRLLSHLSYARNKSVTTHRANWIRSVNFLVTIELIGEVDGDGDLEEMELIRSVKALGYDLVNGTDGGEGMVATPSTRKKMSDTAKINCNTPDGREKMRQRGLRHRDPAVRSKDRARAIKQFSSQEVRLAFSERSRQQFATVEARARHAAICGARSIKCVETGVVYPSINEASRELGIQSANIRLVLYGKRPRAGGYKFNYADGGI